MVDDVVLNKASTIERCVARVHEEYGDGVGFDDDLRRQDALVLNLLQACETAIDLAMHVVRVRQLGVPQSGRHAFAILAEAGVLEPASSEDLQRMVGFRNVAVRCDQDLEMEVVHAIVNEELPTFEAFTSALLRQDRR
ncbi:MAG: DUF86 domain-containing protein [Trueperaceae bacterium]|nr:DUF86 domain-containing protein [Trueperaceae bacterium]